MNGRVVYRQQFTRCGKQRCRKCKEGEGHGPYWYAYWSENGRTKTRYIGVRLPPDLTAAQTGFIEGEAVPVEAAPVLRIYLLGQFRVERRDGNEWQSVDSQIWQHRRTRSLLGCLLSSPGRRLSREQAMKLLWPDLDREIASNRLNGAVHELRHILEPDITRVATSHMLLLEHDMLELADNAHLWVDAEAFEQLLRQADTASDTQQAESLLIEADALYKGDYLLEELYSEWATPRRDTLQQEWGNVLLKLAKLRAARGTLLEAIEALDRLRAADPTNETALRWLMVYLTRLHRRAEALRIYRQHANKLQRDYEGDPLPETRALYTMLRQGRIPNEYLPSTDKETILHSTAIRSISPSTSSEAPVPTSASNEAITIPLPAWQPQRHHPHSLLGRQQELENMRRFLAPFSSSVIKSQHPHFLLLTGDAGIGKTRLAEELGLEAYQQSWAVAWSKANETEQTLPYHPWITLLHALLPDPSTSPFVQKQERLHLWEAIREFLYTLCQTHPLLLILDDLQWADSNSIDLLGYLLHHLQEQRILLVATCRDSELSRMPALAALLTELQRKQVLVRLPVQPLAETEIAALVTHLPRHIAESIQKMAAGNPLFAEELAKQAEQYPFSSQAMQMLPATINALFERHLSPLSDACRTLLTQTAQLGEAFELNQLLLLTHGQTEDTIFDLLEEALHMELLRETGTGAHITYHFWHPLLIRYLVTTIS